MFKGYTNSIFLLSQTTINNADVSCDYCKQLKSNLEVGTFIITFREQLKSYT